MTGINIFFSAKFSHTGFPTLTFIDNDDYFFCWILFLAMPANLSYFWFCILFSLIHFWTFYWYSNLSRLSWKFTAWALHMHYLQCLFANPSPHITADNETEHSLSQELVGFNPVSPRCKSVLPRRTRLHLLIELGPFDLISHYSGVSNVSAPSCTLDRVSSPASRLLQDWYLPSSPSLL